MDKIYFSVPTELLTNDEQGYHKVINKGSKNTPKKLKYQINNLISALLKTTNKTG